MHYKRNTITKSTTSCSAQTRKISIPYQASPFTSNDSCNVPADCMSITNIMYCKKIRIKLIGFHTLQNQIPMVLRVSTANRKWSQLALICVTESLSCCKSNCFGHPSGKYIASDGEQDSQHILDLDFTQHAYLGNQVFLLTTCKYKEL